MKEHRNLRTLVRRRKSGISVTYYFYDMRRHGMTDIPLGSDRDVALGRWAELEKGHPRRPKSVPKDHPNRDYLNLPAWAKRLYNGAKYRAKDRGLPFTITKQEFAEVVVRDVRCAVTGLEFQFSKGPKRGPFSPSIDRIESSKGYEAGNVRIVTLAANVGMSNWGESALHDIAAAVAKKRSANQGSPNEPITM